MRDVVRCTYILTSSFHVSSTEDRSTWARRPSRCNRSSSLEAFPTRFAGSYLSVSPQMAGLCVSALYTGPPAKRRV